ncbi:MAG: tetratricopeptide repeat protein [Dokdonella sp.]|uniref:O-linked N-acetylglucosamine transferase, SPINDLY family protein n=1 Tax=Dokdonella sp. TaxID=2291710 RepID=UPI003263B7E2
MFKKLFGRKAAVPGKAESDDHRVQLAPTEPLDVLIAQGNALEDAGDVRAAADVYEDVVRRAPDYWRGFLNLGNALRLLGRMEEAASRYRQAIALEPSSPAGHLNLANVLLASGENGPAAESYRNALRHRPGWADAWFGLGGALDRDETRMEAIDAFERALDADPGHGMAPARLARALVKNGGFASARAVIASALAREPGNSHALAARGSLEQDSGDSVAAAQTWRTVVTADPANWETWSSYLFALNFIVGVDNETILAEHRRFEEQLTSSVTPMRPAIPSNGGKRLRIGYVSADFRRHSVSCFIEGLLRHHDHANFEVYCYYNHASLDEITARLRALSDHWCDIAGVDDDAVAQRIADDGIDILVDLGGHTTGNRLPVFARKPAPLQFTWLGYLCTTGLDSIDYRICDAITDPVGITERWQVETPARLPGAQWCYQPQVALPDVTRLPMLDNGYWTFGSFNQSSKLNVELLHTWAGIIAAFPESRMRFVGVTDPILRERILAAFSAHAVSPDRIDIEGRIPIDAYFAAHADIDIAFDSFPYNGATTTCDALVMGVPVVTVLGDRAISRGAMSLLTNLDMADWVAPSPDALSDLLKHHLRDPERVAGIRAGLRSRMQGSSLMDAERFTREMESIFRGAWRQRCPG